jgi:hypothetical protein
MNKILKIIVGVGMAGAVAIGTGACGSSSHSSTARTASTPNYSVMNGTYNGQTGGQGVVTMHNGHGNFGSPDLIACPSCSEAMARGASLEFHLRTMTPLTSGGFSANGTVVKSSDPAWAAAVGFANVHPSVGSTVTVTYLADGNITLNWMPGIEFQKFTPDNNSTGNSTNSNSNSNSNESQSQSQSQPQQSQPVQNVPAPQSQTSSYPAPSNSWSYSDGTTQPYGVDPSGGSGQTGSAANDPTDNGPAYSYYGGSGNTGTAAANPADNGPAYTYTGGSGNTGTAAADPADNGS